MIARPWLIAGGFIALDMLFERSKSGVCALVNETRCSVVCFMAGYAIYYVHRVYMDILYYTILDYTRLD